jgi:hypothetical protein
MVKHIVELSHWSRMQVALPLAAFILATASTSAPAAAVIEPILARVPLNQPWEAFFPNEFDTQHPKKVTLQGVAENPTDIDGALVMFFDWIDPSQPGQVFTTPAVTMDVPEFSTLNVLQTAELPFCPPQVSLHFRTASAPVIEFEGTFTHECLVPEPASGLLAGLGALATAMACRRRSRVAA